MPTQRDYMNFFRTEMMPVMRKAQDNGTFAGLDVTVPAHGGEWGLTTLEHAPRFVRSARRRAAGRQGRCPEGTRALLAKGQGLITPLEGIVRRRVAELSF
jgi:hypothetical protein